LNLRGSPLCFRVSPAIKEAERIARSDLFANFRVCEKADSRVNRIFDMNAPAADCSNSVPDLCRVNTFYESGARGFYLNRAFD
jgi:hypothetical protein